MAVPYIFGSQTQVIPLSNLDANFATPITMGGQAVHLGDTVNLNSLVGTPGRNRLINGDFRVSQYQGSSSVIPTTSGYYVDRWNLNIAKPSQLYAARQTGPNNTPLAGNTMYVFQVEGNYSVAAGEAWVLQQIIEADNISDLDFGNPGAQSLSLSFSVFVNAGIYGGAITNYAGTRSYPFTWTVNANGTWQRIVVTIPGDIAGTWVADGNAGAMRVSFDLGSGTNNLGPPGAWAAANYAGATGTHNFVASGSGNAYYITDVQLELAPPGATPANPIATTFERRPIGQELALCQRYFETTYDQGISPGTVNSNGSEVILDNGLTSGTGQMGIGARYKVTKRAAPTITIYSVNTGAAGKIYDAANNADVTASVDLIGMSACRVYGSPSASTTQINFRFHWTASAEL